MTKKKPKHSLDNERRAVEAFLNSPSPDPFDWIAAALEHLPPDQPTDKR